MKPDLLAEIETHMERCGIGPHRFGILAVNNGRLVERLRAGKRNWPETITKVRKYLDENAVPAQ